MNRPTSRGTTIDAQLEAHPQPRHRHRSRRKWLAIGLVVIAVAAGCSGSHHGTAGSTTPPQAPAGAGRSMTFHLAAASAAPVSTFVPDQPVGETPTSIEGITLQIYVVKRTSPKTVLVVFGLQMTAAAISSNPNLGIESGLSWNGYGASSSVSGVGLLDTAGLKLYQPYMINPKDDATCLCTLLNSNIIPSDNSAPAHLYLSAVVAAPPDSVSTASFVTQLGTIPNVRITS